MNGPDDLVISRARWRVARPFVLVGSLAVLAGGLAAAVAGPLDLSRGAWLAAYLVLVVGVAQVVLGMGRAWLPALARPGAGRVGVELAAWNLGSLVVMAGTLVGQVWLVVTGSVLLVVALVSWAASVLRHRDDQRVAATAYLLFVAFLAVSVLVGISLSLVRNL